MDTFFRHRLVTNTRERFISQNNNTGSDKFYAIQNLGPAKVTVHFASFTGSERSYDIRPGDFIEVYCSLAEIQVAAGESLDVAVLQWQPVS